MTADVSSFVVVTLLLAFRRAARERWASRRSVLLETLVFIPCLGREETTP